MYPVRIERLQVLAGQRLLKTHRCGPPNACVPRGFLDREPVSAIGLLAQMPLLSGVVTPRSALQRYHLAGTFPGIALGMAIVIAAMLLGRFLIKRQRAARRTEPTAAPEDEESLYTWADYAHDGILINCENEIVFVNRRLCEIVGFARDELIGASIEHLIVDASTSAGLCRYLEACPACRLPWPIRDVFRSKNDENIHVEVSVGAGRWAGRHATVVIVRDISDRLATEARVRETDELVRQITDNIREVFFIRDLEGDRMVYVSPAYAQIWGRPLCGCYEDQLDFVASVHPDDKSRVMAGVAGQKQGKFFHGEYRIVRPDGEVRWIRSRTFPVCNERGEIYRVAGIAEDITERKIAEDALRASEWQLRQIIDLVPHMIFAKDEMGHFILANAAMSDFYGKSTHEIVGLSHDTLHPASEEVARMLADDKEVIDTRERKYISEEVAQDSQGHEHVFETVKIPYPLANGSRRAVLGVATDITARKQAEAALKASERKYRLLMEHASDAILLADMDGNLCYCNRKAEELLGYRAVEIQRVTINDLHPPEVMPKVREVFDKMASEESVLIEIPTVRKDGSTFIAEINSTFIQHGDAVFAHGIFRDITARKQAEAYRLEQAKQQRDTLVREVHHRIKNNLQGVAGLLRQHVTQYPTLKKPLEAAIGQVHSVAIVHGLQGHLKGNGVALCEMTLAISQAASGVTGRLVEPLVELGIDAPIYVREEEAVPLALVLNELLFNAIKHSADAGTPVKVRIHESGSCAYVRVRNAGGRLPDGFDFGRGIGLGTGLRLVRSLLPPRGIVLTLEERDDGVLCELELSRPVVDLPRKRREGWQGEDSASEV